MMVALGGQFRTEIARRHEGTGPPTLHREPRRQRRMYAGLTGAGLYQVDLTVPATLAAGTYPVVVTQGGVSSRVTAVLKIAGH